MGLLYHSSSLDAAWDLVKDWTAEEHAYLRREVPRTALHTEFRGRTVREIALEVLELSRAGLRARGRLDRVGDDESGFLSILEEIARRGTCPAEVKLEQYRGPWQGSVDPVFTEYAY